MELTEAISHALDGRAILFTGAGFSRGALNIKNKAFKTGGELASYFAVEAGLPDGVALDDAAEAFSDRFGSDRLIKELQEEFTVSELAPAQNEFAKVPWKRVYTTNYDNIFEIACSKAARRVTAVSLSQNIRDIPKDALLCVHLNGYVGSLTRETIWSEIKLTDTNYLTGSVADSAWATLFRQDLEIARAIFFVGYSVGDLDLRRLLFQNEALQSKSFFIIGSAPDPATIRRTGRFGTVVQVDTDRFASDVAAIAATHVRAATGPLSYCVREYEVSPPRSPLADRFVFDLLSLGQVRPEYVWESLHGGPLYALARRTTDQMVAELDAGRKVIALHSDLGNGKTLILETFKCRAREVGYSVHTLVQHGDSLFAELDHAIAVNPRVVFVVDNYPDWLNALKFFGTNLRDGVSLVVAARSSAHDILVDRLTEVVRAEDIIEISVDTLDSIDVDWVVTFLNQYGLWGASAAWSKERKAEQIWRVCRGEWHAILLRVFESPQIVARFKAVFDDVRSERNYYEPTVAVLILTVLNYAPSLNTLVDLCGQRVLETGFRRDRAVREIIDFSSSEVKLRSAVAAEYVLKQIVDINIIVQVLITLAKAADKTSVASAEHFNIFKSLMRFSSLQFILPEVDKAKAVLRYYESIKTLRNCRTNPLFWLQYAIACLVIEEFERAQKYFDSAYAFANDLDHFDTYQIDNHYARFLLTKAARSANVAEAMPAFRKARSIIFQQVANERLHYPYRVAISIAVFFDTFATALDANQKQEIARAAKYIIERIETLPEFRQEQKHVADCWAEMGRIVETVGLR